jgi:Sec-independent protein translocase protein TatA
VQKQTNPNFKVKSLDDVLKVAYDDMVSEKRIKYTAPQAVKKATEYLKELKDGLENDLKELETGKDTIPASKYAISYEKIQSYIKAANDTINQLNSLKGGGIRVYLTLIAFVFGPNKVQELRQEFNLTETQHRKFLLKKTF